MKYGYSFIILLAVALLICLYPNRVMGQFSFGAGSFYGEEIGKLGLNFDGSYHFSNKLHAGIDFVWWPERNEGADSRTFTEINAKLKFIPFSAGRFDFFSSALGGFHYADVSIVSMGSRFSSTDNLTGLGGEIGITYNFNRFSILTRYRRFFSGFDQNNFGTAIRIKL